MRTLPALLLLSACALSAGLAPAATEETLAKSFPATAGGSVVVEVDVGSIDVVAEAARAEVSVDVWRKISRGNSDEEASYLKDNPVEFIQDGTTVTVRARGKLSASWSWFGGWHNRNEARYTVHVPAKFNAVLKTSGGSIAVTGISGSTKANTSGGSLHFTALHGPVDGHTSGGSIQADDCDGELRLNTSGGGIRVTGGSGTLNGDTSGGSITVKQFAGPVVVETSSGGITLEGLRASARANTSGGSIHASFLAPLTGAVDLSTSGGGITMTVASDAAFSLDASSSGGGVNCDLPLTVQGKLQRDRAVGTVNGGGPSVHLRTSGGGIRIHKGQPEASISK